MPGEDAAPGDGARARDRARSARKLTGGVDAEVYVAFAELIAGIVEGRAASSAAATLVRKAAKHEFLDALVVAYRAHPPLLQMLATDGAAQAILVRVLREANDHELARAADIALPADEDGVSEAHLTRRETEVLAPLGEELSNAEIADRRVIAPSTVKDHVHQHPRGARRAHAHRGRARRSGDGEVVRAASTTRRRAFTSSRRRAA